MQYGAAVLIAVKIIFHHNAMKDFRHFLNKTVVSLIDDIYPYKLESFLGEKYLNVKIKNRR